MKLHELHEAAIGGSKAGIAMDTMVAYLERKLGETFLRVPGVEHFHNTADHGYGIRYVIDGSARCVRFNWSDEPRAGQPAEIRSIDIFNGTTHDPNFSIHSKGVSLVLVLPVVVSILKSPTLSREFVFPVSPEEVVGQEEEEAVTEARRDDFTAKAALDDMLDKMVRGKKYTRSDFIGSYHIVNAGVFDTIFNDFADKFDIEGRRVGIKPGVKLDALRDSILSKAGVVEVTRGGQKETYAKTEQEEDLEGNSSDRIPYGDVLEHLEGLVEGIIKGAFNALFVAGKGGTGKTQTVERVLAANGLSDGHGYFKNSGSASAPGIYTLLYHHRNEIILFDDSDGALGDQDARNILKSATDTKKVRKINWSKKASWVFDPEQVDAEAYEDDLQMAPKYFEFTGRIIFISNLPLDKLDPDGALRTRAFVINVDPTDEELFQHMGEILYDIKLEDGLELSKEQRDHVLDIVKTSTSKSGVSLRKLVRALNLCASGAKNWEKLVELYS